MTEPAKPVEEYRCQFCEQCSPASEWKDDACPFCGCKYNWMLAQDDDDG